MKTKSLLLLMGALILSSVNLAQAEDTASQILEAVLGTYADITVNGDKQTKTMEAKDGTLNSGFTTVYTIKANNDSNLELFAKTKGDTEQDAFFSQNDKVYVVLSNITVPPTDGAIANAMSNPDSGVDNPNAIAYEVTSVTLDGATTTEPQYIAAEKKYKFTAKTGTTTATTQIGTSPLANTYSYDDQAGTYQAVVTLTKSST